MGVSAVGTFSLSGCDVHLGAQSGADGQVRDGTVDVFVGGHAVLAVGTSHSAATIPMNVYLDNVGRKCYFIDDEIFESEEFCNADDFHGARLGY
jgi:hypothetical protein